MAIAASNPIPTAALAPATLNWRVDGLRCAACASSVEQALVGLDGVLGAQVNALTGQALIRARPDTALPALFDAVRTLGYRLRSELSAPALDTDVTGTAERRTLWRMAVAWLCAMQAMMYSVPFYTGQWRQMPPDTLALMQWAGAMLSLPVVIFCAWPWYVHAWRELRQRRVSMDAPIALACVASFAASVWAAERGEAPFWDSLTMFAALLLTGQWLAQRMRNRAAANLERLIATMPDQAHRLRDDPSSIETVDARVVEPGDRLWVKVGEAVPCDGTLISEQALVDESILTGESDWRALTIGAALHAGTFVRQTPLTMRADRKARDSRLAHLQSLSVQAANAKPWAARLIDSIAQPFLLLVIAAATLAFVWHFDAGGAQAAAIAVSILVVTCPCALSLAQPVVNLVLIGRLARAGMLVSDAGALERLSRIRRVVFDKTGTLTEAEPDVRLTRFAPRYQADDIWRLAGALEAGSVHPIARAIARQAPDVQPAGSVIERIGQGSSGVIDGHKFDLSRAPGSAELRLTRDGEPIAHFAVVARARDDAPALIERLRRAGLAISVCSGDDAGKVAELVRRLGIDDAHARCTPERKLALIKQWQARGEPTLMIGDGVNDAPVLAGADVSIAMPHGAPIAKASADIVLTGAQLGAIGTLIQLARQARRITVQNIVWALGYNLACVPAALAGWLSPWMAALGMSLSATLVLANALRLNRVKP